MKKIVRPVVMILAAMLLLSSCNGQQENVQETTTATAEVTEQAVTTTEATETTVAATTINIADAPVLKVVSNGSSKFKVVRGDSASDEVAVAAFLEERLPFYRIAEVVSEALTRIANVKADTVEELISCDRETRRITDKIIRG